MHEITVVHQGQTFSGVYKVQRVIMLVACRYGERRVSTYGYRKNLQTLAEKTLMSMILASEAA